MTRRELAFVRAGLGFALLSLALRSAPSAVASERLLRQRVDSKLAERMRLRRELSSLDSLEREAPALRAALVSLAPRLLAGATDAEAKGDLSARLRSVAEEAGAQLERVQGLPDTLSIPPLRRVVLDLELLCDLRCLSNLLARTERLDATLGLEKVRITSLNDAAAAAPESLRVALTFTGWYLPPDGDQ